MNLSPSLEGETASFTAGDEEYDDPLEGDEDDEE